MNRPMQHVVMASLAVVLAGFAPLSATAQDVGKYDIFEQAWTATGLPANPYTGVKMDVRFVHESGSPTLILPAFWDGGSAFKVRFAPTKVGVWNYTTSSDNASLNNLSGALTCVESTRRGFVEVDPSYPHFFSGAQMVENGFWSATPVGITCSAILIV